MTFSNINALDLLGKQVSYSFSYLGQFMRLMARLRQLF